MSINITAVLICVVVNFFIGFLWYTPLFGKIWGREMGFNRDEKPQTSVFVRGLIFMVIANFLMAFVFAHNIKAWEFVPEMKNAPLWGIVLNSTLFTWLGFYLPGELGNTVWEKKSWTLFFINTGYHFITLLAAAIILVMMK